MVQHTSSVSNVSHCICCVRPLLKDDIGTRKMRMSSYFSDMLHKCSVHRDHIIYNEQCRLMREGVSTNEVFVCYICQPSWKKSLSQYTFSQSIDLPYGFMLLSDNYMKNVENAGDRVDKLSLLKYVLCCSSEVHIVVDGETTDIVYHPLRKPR
jgi:hypothetical protein